MRTVDLRGAGFAHHAHDLAAGGAADDGIVDQDDALAFEQRAHGIELELHAEIADGLLRLDERAADVVIADQAHAERQAGFEGVADGRGHAGVGHRHDDVGIGGLFAGQQAAQHFAALVDGAAEDQAIGPREIDVLEDAVLGRFDWGEMHRLQAAAGNAQHLAGFDLANVFGADQIEGAGFEATTQASPRRPRHSGRKPRGSRTA